MKVIVIGCTHAGTSAVVNIARLYPDAEITIYERNDNVSFLSCGIALYIGDVVKDPKGLFYSSPEALAEIGAKTRMSHDILDVDIDNKVLKVKNLLTGEEFNDSYDKLIITSGSWPIIPKIQGINLNNILLCKNFHHSNTIIERAKTANNILVVGAGYIGVELAEAFETIGKKVTLIDSMDRVLSKYLDKEFTDIAENAFTDHGITLALGETVSRFEGENGTVTKVVTEKGEYDCDLVVLCIGFKPSTELFNGKLDMLKNGALITDEYMITSKKDIFAAGDCCSIIYNPTGKREYIPLATNAIRMGTLIARNLISPSTRYLGTQGTSGIKIYDYNISSTGLTEESAKIASIEVGTSTFKDNYRPEFMPTTEPVTIKLVYNISSKEILGAQFISKIDLTQMMNTMSVVIQNKMTVDELAFVDFFFQPHFNKPWSILNSVALNVK